MDAENKHMDPIAMLPKYFAGDAAPEEHRIIDEWLASDSRNRKEFEAFSKLWHMTGNIKSQRDINIDAEWKKMESYMGPTGESVISLTRILRIAASVVLISALTFAGLKISSIRSEKAPVADLSVITLPDGSMVSLNAGSKISYAKGFGETHRNLKLNGEAYFEVEKNVDLPFVIEAQGASVRVTGTKFNVKAYRDQTEIKVTVTEGSVALYETRYPEKKAALTTGETGTFDKTMKVVKKQAVLDLNDIAWKTRIMDFSNTTLDEVGYVISNTYHLPVIVDPAVQKCSITVRFENQDLSAVLSVLKSTLDLNIKTGDNRIVISGNGC